MPYSADELLKIAAVSFIDTIFKIARPVTTPISLVANEVETACNKLDDWSERRLQRTRSWSQMYQKFLSYKSHFATAPDSNGKYVHFFLCNIEKLPSPQFEQGVFHATTWIDAEPEAARTQIGAKMREMIQSGSLSLGGQGPLILSN